MNCETIFSESERKGHLPNEFRTANEGVTFFKDTINLSAISHACSITETEMLTALLDEFFDLGIVDRIKIETIIVIGDELNKGSRIKNIGHYIQHIYKIENADVITFSGNHCSNIEYALSYSESLLKSGDFDNIIILAVNKLIRDEERIIGRYAIQGDGAGIVFLNKDFIGGVKLIGKHSYTCGTLFEANLDTSNSFLLCKNYLICLSEFMRKFEIKTPEISNVIIQNANYLLINQCLNSLGFKNEQIFSEKINTYGHLDCIDFIVNLKAILDQKPNLPTKIISFGTGWAGSNICLLMEIV